ncbi:MAG: hypothetical protein JXA66_04495 [Oligoflexia bacterium]|nr:hypothetical protein [Oligoflexia bacterium]
MKKFYKVKTISELILFFFFTLVFSAYAAPVPVNSTPSKMNVLIEGGELKGERVSNKEYRINERFHVSPSFLNGDFHRVVEKLDSILQQKELIQSKYSTKLKDKIALIRKKRIELVLGRESDKYDSTGDARNNVTNYNWNRKFYANVLEESNLRTDYEQKLNRFSEQHTVMLEYVTIGDGRRMVTNIAVTN